MTTRGDSNAHLDDADATGGERGARAADLDAAVARSRTIGRDGSLDETADLGDLRGAFGNDLGDASVEPSHEEFGPVSSRGGASASTAHAADADAPSSADADAPVRADAAAGDATSDDASTGGRTPGDVPPGEDAVAPRAHAREGDVARGDTAPDVDPADRDPAARDAAADDAAHDDAAHDGAAADDAERAGAAPLGPVAGPAAAPTVAPAEHVVGPATESDAARDDADAESAGGASSATVADDDVARGTETERATTTDADGDGEGARDADAGAVAAGAVAAGATAVGATAASSKTVEVDRTRRVGDGRDDETFAPLRLSDESGEAAAKPRKRSNRGAAFWLALIGTIVFGALFLVAFAALRAVYTDERDLVATMLAFAPTAAFYLPVVAVGVLFVLWAIVSNRAGHWSYVIATLVAGVVAYLAYHAGVALQLTFNTGGMTIVDPFATVLDPTHLPAGLVAALLAMLTVQWFGGMIASRGQRLRAKHRAALRSYESASAVPAAEPRATASETRA